MRFVGKVQVIPLSYFTLTGKWDNSVRLNVYIFCLNGESCSVVGISIGWCSGHSRNVGFKGPFLRFIFNAKKWAWTVVCSWKIQVICDVTLHHWVSSCWHSEDHSAYIFWTAFPWRLWHCDPSKWQEIHTHWHSATTRRFKSYTALLWKIADLSYLQSCHGRGLGSTPG
jgi:hypothetical protein